MIPSAKVYEFRNVQINILKTGDPCDVLALAQMSDDGQKDTENQANERKKEDSYRRRTLSGNPQFPRAFPDLY